MVDRFTVKILMRLGIFFLLIVSVCSAGLIFSRYLIGRANQDWASLNRYHHDNQGLNPPGPRENRVVFFGDSITDTWAYYFDTMFPDKPYIGRGISGQTTPQMLVRFRQDVVALSPAVVVILAGTNDIAGNTGLSTQGMIEDNLISMVEIAKANGIRIVLSSVLPVNDYPHKGGLEPGPKVVALNAWIKEYSAANDIVYLDYHSAMVDENLGLRQDLSADGLHPNTAGYWLMTPLVEASISEAFGQ